MLCYGVVNKIFCETQEDLRLISIPCKHSQFFIWKSKEHHRLKYWWLVMSKRCKQYTLTKQGGHGSRPRTQALISVYFSSLIWNGNFIKSQALLNSVSRVTDLYFVISDYTLEVLTELCLGNGELASSSCFLVWLSNVNTTLYFLFCTTTKTTRALAQFRFILTDNS